MKKAVLLFASGSGKQKENVRNAIRSAERLPGTTVIVKSGLYEFLTEKGTALCACAVLLTDLTHHALFGACRGIEAAMGRIPDDDSGHRLAKIELLLYEGVQCSDSELRLPHPDLLKRAEFLIPLSEIFSDGKALGFDFGSELSRMDTSLIKQI